MNIYRSPQTACLHSLAKKLSEYTFCWIGPNNIASSSGHTIETLDRAGICVALPEGSLEIDSEMLSSPMSLVIYRNSVPNNLSLPASVLLDEIVQGLKWAGFSVELI